MTRSLALIILIILSSKAYALPRGCLDDHGSVSCLIGFEDLWRGGDAYVGRQVHVSGYLVLGLGRLVLAPGKDHFAFQGPLNTVGIEVDPRVFELARKRMTPRSDGGDWNLESRCPVLVYGTFERAGHGELATLGRISTDADGLSISMPDGKCGVPPLLSFERDVE